MVGDRRRLAERGEQRVVHMVDLDRREPQPLQAGGRPGGAHEPRQVEAGVAVAVAAEVDSRQHDFPMPLLDPTADLCEHGICRATARCAAHEWDDAEVAREAAAVLHLDERAHAVEAGVGLNAADRADVTGDESGRLLAALRHDDDVLREARKCIRGKVGAAAGDVHAAMRPRSTRRFFAGLGQRLVRHTARVDDRDVGVVVALHVAVDKEPLTHLVRVDVRNLATEKTDRERRQGSEL